MKEREIEWKKESIREIHNCVSTECHQREGVGIWASSELVLS